LAKKPAKTQQQRQQAIPQHNEQRRDEVSYEQYMYLCHECDFAGHFISTVDVSLTVR